MTARIICGDALTALCDLPDQSVNCCVTSPPYWGLRDYGTATWEGGEPDCEHVQRTNKHGGTSNRPGLEAQTYQYRDICPKCGAVRVDGQIGLEETPEAYVSRLVEVFREVRRVLKDDGTLWLNLGDSYATGGGKVGTCPGGGKQGEKWAGYRGGHDKDPKAAGVGPMTQPNRMPIAGLKPKDLVGIPWRVAFALQADGWYLRQDIIWHKPNPMPESVRDRCTKAHEYIFLLSKSPRYYFDQDEMTEEPVYPPGTRKDVPKGGFNSKYAGDVARKGDESFRAIRERRNRRDVWTVATKPYKEAHFATFPPDLIRPCVRAGCPAGGTVLDPFAGAGTTGLVALEEGRDFLGIELNPEYVGLIEKRLAPLLAVRTLDCFFEEGAEA